MPGKGIARSARRSVIAFRAVFSAGILLVVSCSGGSKFSSNDGDAGESSGGTTGGSAGDESGGGSIATGGRGGTVATGGTSGASSGGTGGDPTGGSGGTDPEGGGGGTSGSSSGGSGLGGASGTGGAGSGGQTGGVSGSGGASSEDCPLQLPNGACEPDGLVCRYSNVTQCLCTTPEPVILCTPDPRCTLLLDRPARVIIDGGVTPDGGAPIPTQTCTCLGGTWNCRVP